MIRLIPGNSSVHTASFSETETLGQHRTRLLTLCFAGGAITLLDRLRSWSLGGREGCLVQRTGVVGGSTITAQCHNAEDPSMEEVSVLADLVGRQAPAGEVISCLLDLQPQVSGVQLLRLKVSPSPSLNGGDRAAVTALSPPALQLRSEYGVPFWTALMLTVAHSGDPLPEGILRAALFHQDTAAASLAEDLKADKISSKELKKRIDMLDDNSVLALASRILLRDGGQAHLPMLDFRLKPTPANLTSTVRVVEQLGLGGVILDSGNSYHFYGLGLLAQAELQVFLAKALLFAPLVDHRWVAHQLIENSCLLRISRGIKGQKVPCAVAYVTP
ncbi:primase 1D-like protein [Nonomuraea fuscirosea]|uniref:primase 1D-like protein n=1 Tax=Nonomuraea fuscirosea TaxID=1291556 RepID=UPI003F4DE4E2